MTLAGPDPSEWSLGAGLKGQGGVVAGGAGGSARAVAFAFAAVGAIVVAMWDLKGKLLCQPFEGPWRGLDGCTYEAPCLLSTLPGVRGSRPDIWDADLGSRGIRVVAM